MTSARPQVAAPTEERRDARPVTARRDVAFDGLVVVGFAALSLWRYRSLSAKGLVHQPIGPRRQALQPVAVRGALQVERDGELVAPMDAEPDRVPVLAARATAAAAAPTCSPPRARPQRYRSWMSRPDCDWALTMR